MTVGHRRQALHLALGGVDGDRRQHRQSEGATDLLAGVEERRSQTGLMWLHAGNGRERQGNERQAHAEGR